MRALSSRTTRPASEKAPPVAAHRAAARHVATRAGISRAGQLGAPGSPATSASKAAAVINAGSMPANIVTSGWASSITVMSTAATANATSAHDARPIGVTLSPTFNVFGCIFSATLGNCPWKCASNEAPPFSPATCKEN